MPILHKDPDDEPSFDHDDLTIEDRILLFKQAELEDWFAKLSIDQMEMAYCLITYPKGD